MSANNSHANNRDMTNARLCERMAKDAKNPTQRRTYLASALHWRTQVNKRNRMSS